MTTEHPLEFTRRAVLTGMVLGAALTPCNVYSGLKIGWSFNMSIAAGLLAAGAWGVAARGFGTRPLSLLENNINQTTASSSASIISGGLVAPIPALTLLTGHEFTWPVLAFWVFCVSILGVVVAAALRRRMIEHDNLAFPAGVATAETMTQIHAQGAGKAGERSARLKALMSAAMLSGGAKLAADLAATAPRLALPGSIPFWGAAKGGASLNNLTLAMDPSLLMIGFGALIGLRAGLSLLVGALVAWAVLGPWAIGQGWAQAGTPDGIWFSELVTWLLWPGVTLTVVSALTAFAISVFRVWRRRLGRPGSGFTVSPGYAAVLAGVTALIALAAGTIFGLPVWVSVLAVMLSYLLAVIAARVSGETGVTPVGALGKVTQLTYGAVTPGDMAANLMTANITGGAAGQCADMMHDLKTGSLIGATARLQIFAQAFGVLTGSMVGAAVYLVLVPDPAAMLMTPEWPAPAVATWKAVAEVLSAGLGAIPQGAVPAMAVAAVLGFILAVAERMAPERLARTLPSAPAMGVAFVIPAWNSFSLCLGAVIAALITRGNPDWAEKRMTALAAGLVAGESLVGVALALQTMAG
ncbi:MAG: OPT family oligopeptide transporter [Rhodospirillales bacterium]